MDFVKLQATVQRLIDKNGRLIKVQKLSKGDSDSATPWKGPGTPAVEKASKPLKAVFVPVAGSDFGRQFFDDELLKRCDQICLLSGSAVSYEGYHQILDDNVVWKIEALQQLKPADTTLLYAFGVKR